MLRSGLRTSHNSLRAHDLNQLAYDSFLHSGAELALDSTVGVET